MLAEGTLVRVTEGMYKGRIAEVVCPTDLGQSIKDKGYQFYRLRIIAHNVFWNIEEEGLEVVKEAKLDPNRAFRAKRR